MKRCPETGPWTGLPCIRAGEHRGDHTNEIGWTWGPGLAEGDPNLELVTEDD